MEPSKDLEHQGMLQDTVNGGNTPKALDLKSTSGSVTNFYATHKTSTKLIKTVAMILACSSMGIYAEIVGPTIPDLKDRLGANYEEISRTLVARSVGYCVGAVVGGFIAHKNPLHMEMLVFISCLIGALGSAVVPFCRDLWILGIMLHIEGWGQAFINTGTDTMVLAMWGRKAASPVHALHFGFGIGAVLAPQLARPFIAPRNTDPTSTNHSSVVTSLPNMTSTTEAPLLPGLHQSNIEIPYMISAVYSLVFFVVFLAFYLFGRKERKDFQQRRANIQKQLQDGDAMDFASVQNFMKSLSPGSCTGGKTLFGSMFFSLLFLYYANIVGGERAYGRFIFSYAVDGDQGFSVSDAATLNSLFWIGFTSGRGLSAILAYWCSPLILLVVELSVNITCGVALTAWGLTTAGVLWVFTGVLGLFLSPVFPSGLAWSNLYVQMKGLAITVVYIGASVGAIVYQWVTGYLFDNQGPDTLMYVMLGYALTQTLIFVLMFLVARPQGKRFQ